MAMYQNVLTAQWAALAILPWVEGGSISAVLSYCLLTTIPSSHYQ